MEYPLFEWSEEAECSICHEKETSSFDNSACIASEHPEGSVDCYECHDDRDGVGQAHDGVLLSDVDNDSISLKETSVRSESCQAANCHIQDELKDLTATSTALMDSEGTVVNPHDMPVNEKHAELSCVSCHEVHSELPVAETAKQQCLNCHHHDVFECYTCHAHG